MKVFAEQELSLPLPHKLRRAHTLKNIDGLTRGLARRSLPRTLRNRKTPYDADRCAAVKAAREEWKMLDDPIPGLKEQLRREIVQLIAPVTQSEGAMYFDTHPSRINDLCRGRLQRFSLEKLIRLLALVDREVEMRVKDHSTKSLGKMMSERRRAKWVDRDDPDRQNFHER